MSPLPRPHVAASAAPYARVKRHLHAELARGRWPPGARLPSEAELVAQFGVSRMTVHRALRELQAEGLIERVKGAGSYALQPHRAASTLTIRDLQEEIAERGGRHRAELHLARAESAGPALAAELGVRPGERVFHTLILHLEDDRPLQCEDRYVNPAAAPDYLSVDFTRTTPTHHLLQVAPMWEAQVRIEAGLATAQEAALLCIDPAAPCLIVIRRTERQGLPITLARLVHPGASYALQGHFQP